MKTRFLPECRLNAASRLSLCLLAATVGLSSAQAQVNQANTSTGHKAGAKVTTGKKNTADGAFALMYNKKGKFNTAIGTEALKLNKGSSNVAIGYQALKKNIHGRFNVGIGDGALKFNVSGKNNVALGMDAGALVTGSDNISIDHPGVAGESGIIRIGSAGTHTKTVIAGKIFDDGSGAALSGQISVGGKIQVPGAGVNTKKAVFIHHADLDNTGYSDFHGNYETVIDHPMCNGNPDAILFLTHREHRKNTDFEDSELVQGAYFTTIPVSARYVEEYEEEYDGQYDYEQRFKGGKWTITSHKSSVKQVYQFNVMIVVP